MSFHIPISRPEERSWIRVTSRARSFAKLIELVLKCVLASHFDGCWNKTVLKYKWGFVTDVNEDRAPKGLNEDIIRFISAKKNEPEFMLQWRLKAYRHWVSLEKSDGEPKWANIKYGPINYQNIVYYSAPKQKPNLKNLDELDPEIRRTYEKLGIPLEEQKCLLASRLMRCSTAFRWRPRSQPSSVKRA
jgi:hypothetical protein